MEKTHFILNFFCFQISEVCTIRVGWIDGEMLEIMIQTKTIKLHTEIKIIIIIDVVIYLVLECVTIFSIYDVRYTLYAIRYI